MEYKDYLEKMKTIQKCILDYIEDDSNEQKNLSILIKLFDDQKIREDKHKIKAIMHLIAKISDNHHRNSSFFRKIDSIISLFKDEIKKNFANYEIFNVYKSNKCIIFFLFEEKIIFPDKSIAITITDDKYKEKFYHLYFFPEFKAFYDENLLNEIYEKYPDFFENGEIIDLEKFNQNRKSGENENEVCRLIREDLMDDFIDYIRDHNISASLEIEPSIFESNLFLINKYPKLIEYAAFFGSNSIFKYLYLINEKLDSSLWLYSIHGQNKKILLLLKDKYINPKDESYKECLVESIKCHHFKIANNFLRSKLLQKVDFYPNSIKYYNYEFFPSDINNIDNAFYLLCKYDYYKIVDLLLNTTDFDINAYQIFKK